MPSEDNLPCKNRSQGTESIPRSNPHSVMAEYASKDFDRATDFFESGDFYHALDSFDDAEREYREAGDEANANVAARNRRLSSCREGLSGKNVSAATLRVLLGQEHASGMDEAIYHWTGSCSEFPSEAAEARQRLAAMNQADRDRASTAQHSLGGSPGGTECQQVLAPGQWSIQTVCRPIASSQGTSGAAVDQSDTTTALNEILKGIGETDAVPAPITPSQSTSEPSQPKKESATPRQDAKCIPKPGFSSARDVAQEYLKLGQIAEQYKSCEDWRVAQGNYLSAAGWLECVGDDSLQNWATGRAQILGNAVDSAEDKGLCRKLAGFGQGLRGSAPNKDNAATCQLSSEQLQSALQYMTKVADADNGNYASEIAAALNAKGCQAPRLADCMRADLSDRAPPLGCPGRRPNN